MLPLVTKPLPVDDPACVLNLNTPEDWQAWRVAVRQGERSDPRGPG